MNLKKLKFQIMKSVISLYGLLTALLLTSAFVSYDSNSSQKNIGNSIDTTSVNKAGGPRIRDTATISKNRRDSASTNKKSTIGKGNADPSDHIKNQ
jgi:hypothetical protein